ncbi:hypothetical protein Tco_0526182 [Tanacetum coccineum]
MFHRPLILLQIVQLILFIVDSGCTKHMTGNLKLLCNFVEKFLGTVHFGNDQFASILGYGSSVSRGMYHDQTGLLRRRPPIHIPFQRWSCCDADLEVVFKKSTLFCESFRKRFIILVIVEPDSSYTISLQGNQRLITQSVFMAKAFHQSKHGYGIETFHLNFDYIPSYYLMKDGLGQDLPS